MRKLRTIYNIPEEPTLRETSTIISRSRELLSPSRTLENSSTFSLTSGPCNSSKESHAQGLSLGRKQLGAAGAIEETEDDLSTLSENVCGNEPRKSAAMKHGNQQKDPLPRTYEHGLATARAAALPEGAHTIKTSPRGRHHKEVINPANLFYEDPAVELSYGLEEPIEHLLRCAVLHTFVPKTLPNDTTPAQAYQRYIELPPCLEKVQHEKQALAYAHDLALSLSALGFNIIKDLVPLESHQEVLQDNGVDRDLFEVCVSIVQCIYHVSPLQKYGTVSKASSCSFCFHNNYN